MAIRSVLGAFELTEGTLAASGFDFLRVVKFTVADQGKLDNPRETTGSTIVTQHPRPGPQHTTFTVQTRAYYDLSMFWFAMLLGSPTTAAHPAATGVFDHTFKPGGTAPKAASLQWKQVGSQGTIWSQMLGAKIKTCKLMYVNNVGLVFEFQGMGRYSTNISAPSVPSDTTAVYNHPMSMNQQAVTLNSVAWKKPKKFDMSIDNGLTPDWAIDAVRGINRLKLGDTVSKADVQAFYDAYTGSLKEAHDSASSSLNAVVLTVTDSATSIGTGTPTNPAFIVTLPKPYVDDANQDDTNTDPEEKAALLFAYDSGTAADSSIEFTNELTSSFFTGH